MRATRASLGLSKVLDPLLAGDGLAWPLAGPCVGTRSLASYRQTEFVPKPPVAFDFAKTMNRLSNLTTQRTFDRVVALEQASQTAQFVLVEFPSFLSRVNLRFDARLSGNRRANAVEILKRINDLFVVWNVNTQKTRHTCPLLNHYPVTL